MEKIDQNRSEITLGKYRRRRVLASNVLTYRTDHGLLSLDVGRKRVQPPFQTEEVKLTPTETLVLRELTLQPTSLVTSKRIAEVITKDTGIPLTSRTVQIHINHLLPKLGGPEKGHIIHSYGRRGYSLTKNPEQTAVSHLVRVLTSYGELVLDYERETARSPFQTEEVLLSPTETQVFKVLMLQPTRVITCQQISERVTAETGIPLNSNSVATHIAHLRRKLGEPKIQESENKHIIHTFGERGYSLTKTPIFPEQTSTPHIIRMLTFLGELVLDYERGTVQSPLIPGKHIHITRIEAEILKLLMQNPGKELSSETILQELKVKKISDTQAQSIKNYIYNIRNKLGKSGKKYIVSTIDRKKFTIIPTPRDLRTLLDKPLYSIRAIDYDGFVTYATKRGYTVQPGETLHALLSHYIASYCKRKSVPNEHIEEIISRVFEKMIRSSASLSNDWANALKQLIRYSYNATEWVIQTLSRKEEKNKKNEPINEYYENSLFTEQNLSLELENEEAISAISAMMDAIGIKKRDQMVFMLREGINLPSKKGLPPKELFETFGRKLGLRDAKDIYHICENVKKKIIGYINTADTGYAIALKKRANRINIPVAGEH